MHRFIETILEYFHEKSTTPTPGDPVRRGHSALQNKLLSTQDLNKRNRQVNDSHWIKLLQHISFILHNLRNFLITVFQNTDMTDEYGD